MNVRDFLNRAKGLHHLDYMDLQPVVRGFGSWDWREWTRSPIEYLIGCDDATAEAIWGALMKKQDVAAEEAPASAEPASREARLAFFAEAMFEALKPFAEYGIIVDGHGGPSGGMGAPDSQGAIAASGMGITATMTFGDFRRAQKLRAKIGEPTT